MANDTYFKMWRKFKENDVYLDDLVAWHVFEWLLASCNYFTGTYETTLRSLAEDTHLKLSTTVHAIERLEVLEMVVRTTVQKKTIFSICNWKHMQADEGTNLGTTRVQRGYNDLYSYRNKEIKNITPLPPKTRNRKNSETEKQEANLAMLYRTTTGKQMRSLPKGALSLLETYAPEELQRAWAAMAASDFAARESPGAQFYFNPFQHARAEVTGAVLTMAATNFLKLISPGFQVLPLIQHNRPAIVNIIFKRLG